MRMKLKINIKVPVTKTFRTVETKLDMPLGQAANYMAGVAREMVRIPYPGPSAEGFPPHLRTGTLRSGITSFKKKKNLYLIQASAIKGGFNYAQALEYGTRRMRPRPYMRPMLMRTYKFVNNFFKETF